MMRHRTALAALALLALSGCLHYDKPPDRALPPLGAFGTNGDPDVRALDIAALGFAHAIIGDPGRAAYAIAALDYMGGELNSNPRWIGMDALTRLQMLQWRERMRAEVGISATASSQAVLDTMLALARAYQTGDKAAVSRLLASPIFTLPPDEVAGRLGNIPYNASLNAVTMTADGMIEDYNFFGG